MLVKVDGTNFLRDTETMALINGDVTGREEYNFKRKLITTQKNEINTVKEEINNIKTDMTEIKHLLVKLLEKDSNG